MQKGIVAFISIGVIVLFLIAGVTSIITINTLMGKPGDLIFSVDANCDIYAFVDNGTVAFSGYDSDNNYFLYSYDTDTKVRRSIYYGPEEVIVGGIENDLVVYTKHSGDEDVYCYDIATGTETVITSDNHDQYWPTIRDGVVYWVDARNGGFKNSSIYSYDLGTAQELEVLSELSLSSNDLEVFGNYLVFSEDRNLTLKVQLYDLGSNTIETAYKTDMRREGGFGWSPVTIDGDTVVWTDYLNGSAVMFAYDIPTKSTEAFEVSDGEISTPIVQNGRIIYSDYVDGKTLVVSIDIESKETTLIGEYDRVNFYSCDDDHLVVNNWENGKAGFGAASELYVIDL